MVHKMLKIFGRVFSQTLHKPFTVMYPFEKRNVPTNHRGRHIFIQKNCTACTMCARVCPTVAIHLNREKKEISINYSRCIFCSFCVDACKFNALHSSPDYELSEYSLDNLTYSPQRLGAPRNDKVKWRGKECI
nr:4Fe-4S binding protein [Candidatus Njordarchaeota archaeon]